MSALSNKNKIHKYFNRSFTRWNIKEYLDKCEEETFKQKLKHTDYKEARRWRDEHENVKQKEVNGPLIQFLGNNIYGGSNGTLTIESKKRKSTEIDESDSTGIDKLIV